MVAKSQPLAGSSGELTSGYLVSLGRVGAGVLALLRFASPVVVVPAPLLSPAVPPAGGLSPAAAALLQRGDGERPGRLLEPVAAATVSSAAEGNLPPYWAQMAAATASWLGSLAG